MKTSAIFPIFVKVANEPFTRPEVCEQFGELVARQISNHNIRIQFQKVLKEEFEADGHEFTNKDFKSKMQTACANVIDTLERGSKLAFGWQTESIKAIRAFALREGLTTDYHLGQI